MFPSASPNTVFQRFQCSIDIAFLNSATFLERSIAQIEATLDAVRSDPEAVESMARQELGWIRPGETVLILDTPTAPPLPVTSTEPTPTPILSLGR